MKNTIPYILLLVAISIIVFQFANPKVVTKIEVEYREGKRDTLTTIQYLPTPKDTEYVYLPDSVEVDSNGSRSFTTAFDIEVDSLTRVDGEVTFRELTEDFVISIKGLWYPEKFITQVDTLTITNTVELQNPFYDSIEFGFTIGVLLTSLLVLLLGN